MAINDPPAVGNLLEVKFVCYTDDQISLNIRHYGVTSIVGVGATMQEIATAMSLKFHTPYKALMPAQNKFRGVSVANIYPTPRSIAVTSVANDGPGTAAGGPLPEQVTGMITLRTLLAGRANRGRVYVPFPSTNAADVDGEPTAAYEFAVSTLAGHMDDTVNVVIGPGTSLLTPIIYHRSNPLTSPTVASAIARRKWATQRRRGNYGAPNLLPF